MKSSSMDAAVAPGSGVDLRLEKGEVEALHIALAAGVAQGLEIVPVGPFILGRQLLGKILVAASAVSGRQCHFRLNTLSRENRKVFLSARVARLIRSAMHAVLGGAPNFSHGDISLVHSINSSADSSPVRRETRVYFFALRVSLFHFTVTRVRSSEKNQLDLSRVENAVPSPIVRCEIYRVSYVTFLA